MKIRKKNLKLYNPEYRYALGVTFILLSLLSVFLFFDSCGRKEKSGHWPLPDTEIRSLEKTIRNANDYQSKSLLKADSIKSGLKRTGLTSQDQLQILESLVSYYSPRCADTSLYYAYKADSLARNINTAEAVMRGRLALANAMSACGLFSVALQQFDSISIESASIDDRINYWKVGRQMYSNVCNYIGEGKGLYDYYQEKEDRCVDSLIFHLPKSDHLRVFLESQRLIYSGKEITARKNLEEILNKVMKGQQMYGMTAFQIANTYSRSDQTKYAAYLAMASESDIIGGISDGFALPSLSDWLYRENYYSEAFRYINFSMHEASEAGARMRLVKISSMVPRIDEAYRDEINSSLSDFALYAIMVSVVLIAVVAVLALLLREMKKRRLAHSQLAEMSKMKDSYIRDFISLCSAYSEKYDSLSRTVMRKITAGQAQDLLKMVKSGKTSDSENEEFYKTIDRVFLSLYPDFIKNINELLLPDQRYNEEKNNETLTPELRIYGFVRLGVSESAKIAKILNYSSNTVYAYRNRMRNKAINRDSFDEDVMKIDIDDNLD